VECAEFKATLVAKGEQHELAKHAAICPQCAQSLITLAAALSQVETAVNEPAAEPSAEDTRSVESALGRERGLRAWLRSRSTAGRRAAVLSVVVLLTGGLAIVAPRVDLAVYPAWRIALLAAVYGLALTALVWRALLPLHRVPARGRDRALLTLGITLPFLIAALPPAQLRAPVSMAGQGHDCIAFGMLFGLLFALALHAVDRDLRPGVHARWLALAGASLSANVALLFHCPVARPAHGVIVHASMVPFALLLVLMLAAALRALWGRAVRGRTA
jgi:hypothetical protein